MNENKTLYFIAVFPPAPVSDAITALKEDFARRFQSQAALRVMPHITLKAPFYLPAADKERVLNWFDEMPVTVQAFRQEIKGFGVFRKRKSPVVYIKAMTNPALLKLHEQVLDAFRRAFPDEPVIEQEWKFTPHLTIAYRDLSWTLFQEAWKEYEQKNFEAEFGVNAFYLLRHDGKNWESIREHALEGA